MADKYILPFSGAKSNVVKCGFCQSIYRQDKEECPCCGGRQPVEVKEYPKTVPAINKESLNAVCFMSSQGGAATATIRPYLTKDGMYRALVNITLTRAMSGEVEILTGDFEIPTERTA